MEPKPVVISQSIGGNTPLLTTEDATISEVINWAKTNAKDQDKDGNSWYIQIHIPMVSMKIMDKLLAPETEES